jgi:hypothetical protein
MTDLQASFLVRPSQLPASSRARPFAPTRVHPRRPRRSPRGYSGTLSDSLAEGHSQVDGLDRFGEGCAFCILNVVVNLDQMRCRGLRLRADLA